MKVVIVIGTRPEAIKMIPVYLECKKHHAIDVILCSTGQHVDLLNQVWEYYGITPDVDLQLMQKNQSISDLSARVLKEVTLVLERTQPDWVLVHGDTSTGAFSALAASFLKIKVAHVEAGLRTHDLHSPFPEEINRQLISRVADFHFAPTSLAKENLLKEHIKENKIRVTGNTVIDSLFTTLDKLQLTSEKPMQEMLSWLDSHKKLILVTAHRRENIGPHLQQLTEALKVIADNEDVQICIPVHHHPEVKKVLEENLKNHPSILLISAVNYPVFCWLMQQSYFILTDSGGVQEEAPSLNKPVLVFRTKTERPEAVIAGCVKLVGTATKDLIHHMSLLLHDDKAYQEMAEADNPFGDGKAALRIVNTLLQ